MNRRVVVMICGMMLAWSAIAAPEQDVSPKGEGGAAEAAEAMDRDAMKMFRRGMSLMRDRQEDRAVKVFDGVLLNFPASVVRHEAAMELAKYHTAKGAYDEALAVIGRVLKSDDATAEQRAEAMYRRGICQYEQADTAGALAILRQVTDQYPWSVYANEAYYYIGLCHFSAERWTKAVEALKMVGTSVRPEADARNLAEAGQRYVVKVSDKDLRVLMVEGRPLTVRLEVDSGDVETLPLEMFDREGESYQGSIKMASSNAAPGNGTLEFKGADTVRVSYVDENAQDGSRMVKRLSESLLVSTAVGGFMDGAYREYVHGVFADQPTFLNVKDYDADVSEERDRVQVRVSSQYRPTREELAERGIVVTEDAAPHYDLHDEVRVELTETPPHTGMFRAIVEIGEAADAAAIDKTDATLQAVKGDYIFLEYEDNRHIGGLDAPRRVVARAEFLTGELPDVWVAQREVQDVDLKARKLTIEAEFYLRLAEIFNSVGLVERAKAKAGIGLEKVQDVIGQSLRVNLPRETIEAGYRIKWELQVLRGELRDAIVTCQTFASMFPESQLAEQALMQVAKASMASGDTQQAYSILNGILRLQTTSDVKAEAQYNIALLLEREAQERAGSALGADDALKMMGPAIAAYQKCADLYPDSQFAGEALGKVIDFHIEAKDYARCSELLDMIFVDYPDAPFLDEMLLKWGIVLARTQQFGASQAKLQELLRDYPNSAAAGKAKDLLPKIAAMANR